MRYDYLEHNFIAARISDRWKVLSLYLAFYGGVYVQIMVFNFYFEWAHHGKEMRAYLSNFTQEESTNVPNHSN